MLTINTLVQTATKSTVFYLFILLLKANKLLGKTRLLIFIGFVMLVTSKITIPSFLQATKS